METKLIKVESIKSEAIKQAAECIKKGGLAAFPTETVYGLGGDGLNPDAAAKIYAAKGRPSDNPLILHINDQKMLERIVKEVTPMAKKIMTAFCPGPVTVILPKADIVPYSVTGGLDTVAVRMPDNDVMRELIRLAGTPIAGPSANISGRPSPTTAQAVYHDLHGHIDMILDNGPCGLGLESTIVDCTGDTPVILRPGAVTKEMLEEIFPKVEIDKSIVGDNTPPKAPGMKYRHYAPKAEMLLFEGDAAKIPAVMGEKAAECEAQGKRIGFIVSEETAGELRRKNTFVYGRRDDVYHIAAEIYEALRYFDDKSIDIILAEGTSPQGIGMAVMNRLRKASASNIVRV